METTTAAGLVAGCLTAKGIPRKCCCQVLFALAGAQGEGREEGGFK